MGHYLSQSFLCVGDHWNNVLNDTKKPHLEMVSDRQDFRTTLFTSSPTEG